MVYFFFDPDGSNINCFNPAIQTVTSFLKNWFPAITDRIRRVFLLILHLSVSSSESKLRPVIRIKNSFGFAAATLRVHNFKKIHSSVD